MIVVINSLFVVLLAVDLTVHILAILPGKATSAISSFMGTVNWPGGRDEKGDRRRVSQLQPTVNSHGKSTTITVRSSPEPLSFTLITLKFIGHLCAELTRWWDSLGFLSVSYTAVKMCVIL